VPAAAVIPAQVVYTDVVAVKKLVVDGQARGVDPDRPSFCCCLLLFFLSKKWQQAAAKRVVFWHYSVLNISRKLGWCVCLSEICGSVFPAALWHFSLTVTTQTPGVFVARAGTPLQRGCLLCTKELLRVCVRGLFCPPTIVRKVNASIWRPFSGFRKNLTFVGFRFDSEKQKRLQAKGIVRKWLPWSKQNAQRCRFIRYSAVCFSVEWQGIVQMHAISVLAVSLPCIYWRRKAFLAQREGGVCCIFLSTRGRCNTTTTHSAACWKTYTMKEAFVCHGYSFASGEILRPKEDHQERKHLTDSSLPIKNESVGIEDDQIPS